MVPILWKWAIFRLKSASLSFSTVYLWSTNASMANSYGPKLCLGVLDFCFMGGGFVFFFILNLLVTIQSGEQFFMFACEHQKALLWIRKMMFCTWHMKINLVVSLYVSPHSVLFSFKIGMLVDATSLVFGIFVFLVDPNSLAFGILVFGILNYYFW